MVSPINPLCLESVSNCSTAQKTCNLSSNPTLAWQFYECKDKNWIAQSKCPKWKLKVNREGGTRRCFAKVSESRHSPLVLVGAPAQGCRSPLIRARIKCSLRVDSSTLHRGESPKTAHNLSWVTHKLSGRSPSSQSPPSHLGDGDHQE